MKPATYLLKAPEQDMQRWRAAAALRRETFAEFIRAALEAKAQSDPGSVQETLELDD